MLYGVVGWSGSTWTAVVGLQSDLKIFIDLTFARRLRQFAMHRPSKIVRVLIITNHDFVAFLRMLAL